MASNATPSSATHPGLNPDLANPQSLLQAALAQGTVSPEEEIERLARLASVLILVYERGAQRDPQHLRDAIELSEAVLRRLPQDSPERLQHLNRLCYACMSEYAASRSRRAIDEAVQCGRLAREEAVATGLPERDLGLYCDILNNVGVALSHQCQNALATSAAAQMKTGMGEDSSSGSSSAADDLDDAIECAREIKTRATRETTDYSTTLSNLVSRLTRRYSMRGDPADYAEAVELLQELQSLSPPGSVKSGLAIMHLGQLAVEKFNKTDALEDLGKALAQTTEGITKLPQDYEGKPACLNQITTLYSSRYKKTNDAADLRNAVHYSNMTLATVPVFHSVRGGYLLNHIRLLRDFANAATSVQDVEEAVSKGHSHLMEMRNEYPERHSYRRFYGDVLGRRYILSQRLEDFADAVFHIRGLCYDYNDEVNKSGTIPPVHGSLISSLSTKVGKLSLAPHGETRNAATGMLYD
jgi:tetratricopeptide (TPR) repeat protein